MIYTLCGSTRFPDAFALANMHLSMMGHVVIGLGLLGHADEPRGARFLTSDGNEETPAPGTATSRPVSVASRSRSYGSGASGEQQAEPIRDPQRPLVAAVQPTGDRMRLLAQSVLDRHSGATEGAAS